jgi:hypothetical protein
MVAAYHAAAATRIKEARDRADAARLVLADAIVRGARDGVRPVELQRRSGYTKERIRQILRGAGVEPE